MEASEDLRDGKTSPQIDICNINSVTENGDSNLEGTTKKKNYSQSKRILAMENLPVNAETKMDAADGNNGETFLMCTRKELPTAPSKTPVSILQELLSRRGTTPKYELVQIEGAKHEPTFRYRVTVADTVALGTGRSKKEAKHGAAKNVLEKLVGNSVTDETALPANPTNCSLDKISGNPIGTLQEMCISRRWPPPTYEMACEEGLPHERQFTIACTVFKYREVGSGKCKKLAKRQAAYKMWEKLQQCPLDSTQFNYSYEAYNSGINPYADLKNSKISTLTTPHSHKVSNFHKTLKQSTGEKLEELQTVPLNGENFNCVEFLQEIASEQQFEVTYVDIEEKSLSGKSQCLVQLSTLPVAVCYGSGSSSKEAQSAAAHNALEYLRVMTKK